MLITTEDALNDLDLAEIESSSSSTPNQHETYRCPRKYQRKSKRKFFLPPTECAVCGLPTTHCHYNVPACHGCKAFFRRSLLNGAYFVCERDSNCEVRAGSLFRCRSCRMDACLRCGMSVDRVELPSHVDANEILNQCEKRKQRIEADRSLTVKFSVVPQFDQIRNHRIIDSLKFIEFKYSRLRMSVFDGFSFYVDQNVWNLLQKQSELANADKHKFLCTNGSEILRRHWLATDLILNVEQLKVMPFFWQLDILDQEALVKHVILVTTTLSEAFYSYREKSSTVIYPDRLCPIMYRNQIVPNVHRFFPDILPLEYDNFTRHIETIERVTVEFEDYCLLKAIIYCNGDTPNLSDRARLLLDQSREIYSTILQRYLQSKLGTLSGARKYMELINLIGSFFHFAQKKRELHAFIGAYEIKFQNEENNLLNWFLLKAL
ncbi:Ligand-binding domain of nuclear hormone receptor [Aphelenchoides besseyi]|nr:Ligand-binding domain of nuclear hormone receptor [Aphelenchoides besseyi]